MKKILLSILFLSSVCTLMAQQPQKKERSRENRRRVTPEMIAQKKTEKMRETVDLTDKQAKKLYKINMEEATEMMQNRPHRRMIEGEGHRQRPEGMRQAPPRGEDSQNMRPNGPRPHHIDEQATLSNEQLKKNAEKREKKIKKIMGEEKYTQWQSAAEQWKKEQRHTPHRPDRTIPAQRPIQ